MGERPTGHFQAGVASASNASEYLEFLEGRRVREGKEVGEVMAFQQQGAKVGQFGEDPKVPRGECA